MADYESEGALQDAHEWLAALKKVEDERDEALHQRDQALARLDDAYALMDKAVAQRDEALARLELNRCNSGHETLPLKLWECPACVAGVEEKLEAERDQALARVAELERGA